MGRGSKLFGMWEQENGENTQRNRKELGEVERCLRSGCVKLDETWDGWEDETWEDEAGRMAG